MSSDQPLSALLAQLDQRDIKVWLDGERLRVNAPAGALTAELQGELVRRKPDLIDLLRLAQSNVAGGSDRTLGPVDRRRPLVLSSSQQRLWFLDQLEPANPAYNIPIVMRLRGGLDHVALQAGINQIVDRHEALRTRFASQDGQPVQVIEGPAPVPLEMIDVSDRLPSEREAAAMDAARRVALQPFDLSRAPLLRGALIQLAPDDHLLAMSVHHIAADGWSLGILGRELRVLYEAGLAHRRADLPALSIQYADYAAWQRQRLDDERLQKQLAYWTRRLGGQLPVLELPTDLPRPTHASPAGARTCALLEPALNDAISAFARAEGATPFMVMLTAFTALLQRLSHQDDLIVGTPIANRSQVETEPLVGCFINSLALRTDVSGNPTLRELLGRVRSTALDAFANQDVPFEKLVEVLQPDRDGSRAPIFQALFSVQNVPFEEPRLGNLDLELVPLAETSRYDLTFELYERVHGLEVWIEYRRDLYTADSIARLGDQYERVLRSLLANPGQRLADVPLLTERERVTLLNTWNETATDYPRESAMHQLFEAWAARTPAAVAATFEGQQLTYAELNARANQMARHLAGLGVGAESIVGVYLERSLEMLVAVLAIHKAGGAYLPLDPLFPAERVAYMLADARAPLLLTQASLAPTLTVPSGTTVLRVDELGSTLAGLAEEDLAAPAHGEQLAYVLYTSGSTGRPKGVQIEQRALVNLLLAMQARPGLQPSDVLLAVTTLSFDIAGLELFLPLVSGASVELVSGAVAADGARLLQALQKSGATLMQATPATWRLLLTAGWSRMPHLRVLCGGETLPRELAGQLLRHAGQVWNVYGPTETTIWSTLHQVTAADTARGTIPIGRPIANTRAYVVDHHGQPVPTGVAGELLLGGDGLARGYLNQPELTASKFVADPFGPHPSGRLYRTGDLVRYRTDGTLEYLARVDTQVKLRGYRIELGEIESVLEAQPSVQQAVVSVREDRAGDPRLAAYVVPLRAEALDAAALRAALRAQLPSYMVPASLTVLSSLPLTPNGKVDRKALPAPADDHARAQAVHQTRPPRDATQRAIAEIWQETLGVARVGLDDNFFEIGGHSLSILQVHARLRAMFAADLSVAELFQYPTIEALASRIQRSSPTQPGANLARMRAQRARAGLGRAHQTIMERPQPA